MKELCHQSIAHITVEWRGQQHARESVESTDPVPHQQHKPDEEECGTAQSGSDEDGRVHAGLASRPKHPKELSFPTCYKS